MADLPNYLLPFQEEASLYLKEGLVKEIEFSQSTYQVLVNDRQSDSQNWAFLQFDKDNQLTDSFCAHEQEEELATDGFAACAHICAAYLQLFNGHKELLHQRFEASIWNALCAIYCARLGDNPRILKRQARGLYTYVSASGKKIFEIEALSSQANRHLKRAILTRPAVTEETSLKFSNLSQEELKLWREGRPAAQLVYELSFWNDIAKWLMLMQERGVAYTVDYAYAPSGLPNFINATFTELKVSFYLSEATLISIIPTFNSIESQLKAFHAPETEIARIEYDRQKHCFHIMAHAENDEKVPAADDEYNPTTTSIACGRWQFLPQRGFYDMDPHPLLSQGTVYNIADTLNAHLELLKKKLTNCQIYEAPLPISYKLHFDNNWNLHIASYLFVPGDLSSKCSEMYQNWAYLDDDGFYRLEPSEFPELETVILERNIPHFINSHRSWLNTQKGFTLHLMGLESELGYQLSVDNVLSFYPKTCYKEKKKGSYEFESWIYIPNEGFYAKKNTNMPALAKPEASWNESQIPLFIKMNQKELELISGFFSPSSPVAHGKVSVELDQKEQQIFIHPEYELKPEYAKLNVKFFDEFSYVPGEGFHEVPASERLPEKYRHALHIYKDQLLSFIKEDLETLLPYVAKIDKELKKPKHMSLEINSIERHPQQGYILKLKYHTDLGSIPASSLWKDIKKKQPFMLSAAGLIDLEDKRFHWLRWLKKSQINLQQNTITLSILELLRLLAFEDIDLENTKEAGSSAHLLRALMYLEPPEVPSLERLKSALRPYQNNGLRWLWFLRSFGLSGLLCDDMGLGKTHQAMALMAAIQEARLTDSKEEKLPFLIICPTSVIYHWQEKLQQYLPEMRVFTFYGAERSLDDFDQGYDLLLTSYGICRIENELLKKIPFELAIFDEIQIAKNHNSRIYLALSTLNVKMNLGLTGTPIENHLRELKALFDLMLPLYMPSEVEFREMFVRPIEKEKSIKQVKLLERLIKPFVLRRKKEDVLLDLPEKIEEIAHCDLSDEQISLYNEVLVLGKTRILQEMEINDGQLPYVHIFALLSALKRICDHPALYLKCPQDYKQHSSGKWDLFVELLSEARESGQKVVVYSQYLGMLDIIEHYLVENGIEFASIRGSTIDRKEELRRFKEDPKCEVFTASLQAAGLGIDLTSASVVFHYDRWWNAARENQATDRVHRIGQKRGVQVFKLVTKDTFEERIDELIRQKGALAEQIVTTDEQESIKQFTPAQLMEFLKEIKSAGPHLKVED